MSKQVFTAEYWIKDGDSKAFEVKEELKKWGCFFDPEFKCWKAPKTNPYEPEFKIIKNLGLVLELDAKTRIYH